MTSSAVTGNQTGRQERKRVRTPGSIEPGTMLLLDTRMEHSTFQSMPPEIPRVNFSAGNLRTARQILLVNNTCTSLLALVKNIGGLVIEILKLRHEFF